MANTNHQYIKYFSLAGISVQIKSDLPILDKTFAKKFCAFQAQESNQDTVLLHHHFTFPNLSDKEFGLEIYRKSPWAIYQSNNEWIYLGIAPREDDTTFWRAAIFNQEHTIGQIYNPDKSYFLNGELQSLTLFPSDQIIFARLLADRQGCYLHASGMIIESQGLLFVGHSGAGKSTIVKMLMDKGELLCDDRMIVRRWPHGFKVHGTWSHGEIPIVSSASAPLRAILLLEKASENRLVPVDDRSEIIRTLPFYVIKPLVTSDWWEKTLDLIGQIAREIPVYRLQFDKGGQVGQVLDQLVQ